MDIGAATGYFSVKFADKGLKDKITKEIPDG